jgi:hypothetical protein
MGNRVVTFYLEDARDPLDDKKIVKHQLHGQDHASILPFLLCIAIQLSLTSSYVQTIYICLAADRSI